MSVTVICGPMFSGKTEALIHRITRAQYACCKVSTFKPSIDDRYSLDYIQSHSGVKENCILLNHIDALFDYINADTLPQMIVLEEAHFFDENHFATVLDRIKIDFDVLVGGLDMDFLGKPFKNITYAMGIATKIDKISAICVCCGKEATMTYKKVVNDKRVEVGAKDLYEARCYDCWSDRTQKSRLS